MFTTFPEQFFEMFVPATTIRVHRPEIDFNEGAADAFAIKHVSEIANAFNCNVRTALPQIFSIVASGGRRY